jgi:hypothetical protein
MRAAAGTRIRRTGALLAAALAFPASGRGAAPGVLAACPGPVPVMPPHPDARHVVLLATAEADTVLAGWGDVRLGYRGDRPPRWERIQVHGQVARATRVAGPAAEDLPAGRVALVPWYAGCGGPALWHRGAAWLLPGTTDVVVGRLRSQDAWVDGVPTVDVLRTDLVRGSGELPGAARWSFDPDELFGLYATLPSTEQIAADPWGAVAPMRAWLAANPESARDSYMRYVSAGTYHAAAHASVMAVPSPLAGTYRIEVSATGGSVHVVYARTELVPRAALFPADTTPSVFPESASGYSLRAEFRREITELPTPRPGARTRFGRRVAGASLYDQMEVWLPGETSADGSRRFRGHLGLWNVTRVLFPDDRELGELIHDWSRRETSNMRVQNPVGEIVLRPDGGVEWTQVMELAPGRAVTLRATRVSDEALHVPVDR